MCPIFNSPKSRSFQGIKISFDNIENLLNFTCQTMKFCKCYHTKFEGRHGEVASLEIVDGDNEAHFRIRQPSIDEPNEFNIEVLRLLDREISPYGYNLTLKVRRF